MKWPLKIREACNPHVKIGFLDMVLCPGPILVMESLESHGVLQIIFHAWKVIEFEVMESHGKSLIKK